MLLGTRKPLLRHLLIGIIALTVLALYWYFLSAAGHGASSSWRALAHTAFLFLAFTLAIGPLSVLWKPAVKLMPWRRETGIWFFVTAAAHYILTFTNLFQMDFSLLFNPAVALGNIIGSVALFFALILAATSSDRAVRFLGIGSWKWLHYLAYTIFYLSALHAIQYAFLNPLSLMHWSRYVMISLAFLVVILQFSAFTKTIIVQRKRSKPQKYAKLKAKISGRKEVAKGTYEISFSLQKEHLFTPGQHTGVNLPKLLYKDPKGKYRVFSIVNTLHEKKKISVAFRNTKSGFKKTLLDLPLKTNVELDSATGYFTLPTEKKDIIFIAGGIGITPFMSMIRHTIKKDLPHNITLHYSNRNKESAAYLQELRELDEKHKRFTLKEHYEENLFKQAIKSAEHPEKKLWYIAGPPGMLPEIKNILFSSKVHQDNIITEEFFGY